MDYPVHNYIFRPYWMQQIKASLSITAICSCIMVLKIFVIPTRAELAVHLFNLYHSLVRLCSSNMRIQDSLLMKMQVHLTGVLTDCLFPLNLEVQLNLRRVLIYPLLCRLKQHLLMMNLQVQFFGLHYRVSQVILLGIMEQILPIYLLHVLQQIPLHLQYAVEHQMQKMYGLDL